MTLPWKQVLFGCGIAAFISVVYNMGMTGQMVATSLLIVIALWCLWEIDR